MDGGRRPGRGPALVLACLTPLVLGSCAALTDVEASETSQTGAALAAPRGVMVLEFDEGLVRPGQRLTRVQNAGTALLRVSPTQARRGKLVRAKGRDGFAVRLPGKGRGVAKSLAAVVVRPRGDDSLNPGAEPLRWGADVRVAARTLRKDDGSNLVQRGVYDDRAQFKLQVDNGRPSCRVKGTDGAAKVESPTTLDTGRWHRLSCQLRDDQLTLRVGRPGQRGTTVHTVDAPVGSVDFQRSVPVAVGAKLNADGRIVKKSPEQFHGLLDNVFIGIG